MPWLERRQRWYAWKSTWKWTAKYELTPIFLLVSWTWWKFLNRTINSDLCSIRKEGNATDISVWVFFLSFNFTILFHDRYALHRISDEEKTFKLARVKRQEHTKKSVPYIVTHDGRTIRYPDPAIKVDDVVKVHHLKKTEALSTCLEMIPRAMTGGHRHRQSIGYPEIRDRQAGHDHQGTQHRPRGHHHARGDPPRCLRHCHCEGQNTCFPCFYSKTSVGRIDFYFIF